MSLGMHGKRNSDGSPAGPVELFVHIDSTESNPPAFQILAKSLPYSSSTEIMLSPTGFISLESEVKKIRAWLDSYSDPA